MYCDAFMRALIFVLKPYGVGSLVSVINYIEALGGGWVSEELSGEK
jgi:archaellum component FlaD/FlaE